MIYVTKPFALFLQKLAVCSGAIKLSTRLQSFLPIILINVGTYFSGGGDLIDIKILLQSFYIGKLIY